ncbi:gp436 family protein [Varunaivibrio sulfuroxidans]|uniref:Phage gp36-like protein n=1 Tax=Varunaivibrio sulfuroxidans TaxID=1773489 RepID=A0A4R3JAD5_9PROT|nr:DUF1320 domain-containing protein [Varunaivibrio sulfuroxidans]TCS62582.1 phage gp36-like protein [Varunaivibrio sulfuroxidans]WES30749.1 DUF1320 domain-containing protein [Varunaivibrio sulfuroxidans]
MTYATAQDMIDRFGAQELIELTDRADPPLGAIDAQVLAGALADADAAIDGYIAVRYDLPLIATPALLVKVACDIARKHLYKDAPLDEVTAAYKDAIALLRDISRGVAELDIAGAEPAADTTGAPAIAGPAAVFNKDSMGGF